MNFYRFYNGEPVPVTNSQSVCDEVGEYNSQGCSEKDSVIVTNTVLVRHIRNNSSQNSYLSVTNSVVILKWML